jgi:gamma-glutamylcyclotransferase (GGCT)/AIG2-like uncharacterized protein YtfP
MKCYVFAYGTLRNAKVRKQILGCDPPSFPSTLSGFRLEKLTLDREVYPVAVEDSSSSAIIAGDYFEVDEKDLILLDVYESEMYWRKIITLDNGINAWVYCK